MVLNNAKTVPDIGSLLITAGSGSEECGLCGNSFEISEFPTSTKIKVPCVDRLCEPCARMWRILSSPTCPACYGNFKCPKVARDQAQISSPLLDLHANDTLQQQSPPDLQIESPLDLQDSYVASYGADADSDDDTVSDPGSPMRGEDDEITAVSELSDEDMRDALLLANNNAGTNFTIQEIEAEIPLADLRTGSQTQLTDTLTQFCIWKGSEGGEDDTNGESSQQLDVDGVSNGASQQDGERAQENPFRCMYCTRAFISVGHLRQHMAVHTIDRLKCSICGRVLGNPNSRRQHEKKHRETDSQRDERLRKVKVAKVQKQIGQRAPKKYRPERVPQVSG